ncbi:hypothetical protein RP062_000114 [Escherichia coli]|nr:hypothetical protein [Escherichia coli]
MKNEIEQIAQQNKMSIEFVSWFFNEKKETCGNVWFMMMAAMWEGWKGRSIEMDKLAAENVAMKSFGDTLFDMYKGLEISGGGIHDEQSVVCQQAALDAAMSAFEEIETPATDRIVAEAEARGVERAIAHLEKKFSNIGVQIMNLQWLADSLREGAGK